jgi:hypothetical protein
MASVNYENGSFNPLSTLHLVVFASGEEAWTMDIKMLEILDLDYIG